MNVVHGTSMSDDESAAIRARVAENMRRIRLAHGMSLRDLAAATGLSKALMSQVERAVANPTVSTLSLIATALDVSFAELTRSSLIEPVVLRAAEHDAGVSGARMLFTMPERRRFDVSEGVIEPGDHGVLSDHGAGALEYGYVVSGCIELVVGDRRLVLNTGDAVQFSAELPHLYRALDVTSTVLAVVSYGNE
jgi:XRE family transcriptional regulator, regulator of sulfur utilization